MSLFIPEGSQLKSLVMEFSSKDNKLRSVVLYGENGTVLSEAERETDTESEPMSNYYTQEFYKGDLLSGVHGYHLTTGEQTIMSMGLFVARVIDDEDKPLSYSKDELNAKN